MSDGVTFSGLQQLPGSLVRAWVAGLDCGTYTVAVNGTIFVPFYADPNGLFEPGYLNAVSVQGGYGDAEMALTITNGAGDSVTVYVPVVIGYAFSSQGQMLRPATADQTKSPQGPALGKTRRNHRFAVLLSKTQGIAFGTDLNNTTAAPLRDSTDGETTADTLFNGVHRGEMEDSYSFDGALCWRIDGPHPAVVCAISGFLETEEL